MQPNTFLPEAGTQAEQLAVREQIKADVAARALQPPAHLRGKLWAPADLHDTAFDAIDAQFAAGMARMAERAAARKVAAE